LAKYKTLPNYELIRPGIRIQFNSIGTYATNNEKEIALLDNAKPFIERLDKPESKPAQRETKSSKKPAKPKK
jgi:hypothetical protein